MLQVLCVLFGMASWIGRGLSLKVVNNDLAVVGVWVELPLLVPVMPEGWSLPAKMSLILQSANVIPFVITLLKSHNEKWVNYEKIIYCLLLIGCTSTTLLSFFWDHSIGESSTPFFTLFFFLAIGRFSS